MNTGEFNNSHIFFKVKYVLGPLIFIEF